MRENGRGQFRPRDFTIDIAAIHLLDSGTDNEALKPDAATRMINRGLTTGTFPGADFRS